MKTIKVLYLKSGSEGWLEKAQDLYSKKINYFVNFEITAIKTKSIARANKDEKIKIERDLIFKRISSDDHLISFDESGKSFKNSIEFAKYFSKVIEIPKKNLVLLIGGSFGLHPDVIARSQLSISLSGLTMSHHIAQVFLLEQIFRSFCIINNRPYHNE